MSHQGTQSHKIRGNFVRDWTDNAPHDTWNDTGICTKQLEEVTSDFGYVVVKRGINNCFQKGFFPDLAVSVIYLKAARLKHKASQPVISKRKIVLAKNVTFY